MRRAIAASPLALALALSSCRHPDSTALKNDGPPAAPEIADNERLITILATNDVHGGIEPVVSGTARTGGVAYFAGVAGAIRKGLSNQYGDHAGVLTVDAGDQFQGTLLSNFSEGKTMFRVMSLAAYDAVVPGNHDFDFGPEGWLVDIAGSPGNSPAAQLAAKRGALLAAQAFATFPLVSANIYERSSLVTEAGEAVAVTSAGCRPLSGAQAIAWSQAKRSAFVKPWVIKEVAGVRVALIGLDHELTAETSMAPNVSDLCFRDAAEAYQAARAEIGTGADVFVLIAHDGNLPGKSLFKEKLDALLTAHPGIVDAVVTGHSHVVERYNVKGVPVIQSGSGGGLFGRIDLVYDTAAKAVKQGKTRVLAGLSMNQAKCPEAAAAFCSVTTDGVAYEGVPALSSADVEAVIKTARAEIAPVAERKLGTAPSEVKRSRKELSPLGNAVADLLRAATKTDVVFINSATLRDTLPPGEVTYERLFKALPFSNKTLVLKPVGREHLVKLALDAVSKEGEYGILVPSGLVITYDKAAGKLRKVALSDGRVLLADPAEPAAPLAEGPFKIGTFDFLTSKVSGVPGLNDVAVAEELGVFRELIADHLATIEYKFPVALDGRLTVL